MGAAQDGRVLIEAAALAPSLPLVEGAACAGQGHTGAPGVTYESAFTPFPFLKVYT